MYVRKMNKIGTLPLQYVYAFVRKGVSNKVNKLSLTKIEGIIIVYVS